MEIRIWRINDDWSKWNRGFKNRGKEREPFCVWRWAL